MNARQKLGAFVVLFIFFASGAPWQLALFGALAVVVSLTWYQGPEA